MSHEIMALLASLNDEQGITIIMVPTSGRWRGLRGGP